MRCAIIDIGYADMDSASGINLFFVQATAGADLRRPMINLAHVFGQAVYAGRSSGSTRSTSSVGAGEERDEMRVRD